jgi:hypothetical protein
MNEAKPPKRERTKEETALQIQRIVNRLLKRAAGLKPKLDCPDIIQDFGNPVWNYFDEVPRAGWAVLAIVNEEESTMVYVEKQDPTRYSLREGAKGVDLTDHQLHILATTGDNVTLTNTMSFEGEVIDKDGLEVQEIRAAAARILGFSIERLNEIEKA